LGEAGPYVSETVTIVNRSVTNISAPLESKMQLSERSAALLFRHPEVRAAKPRASKDERPTEIGIPISDHNFPSRQQPTWPPSPFEARSRSHLRVTEMKYDQCRLKYCTARSCFCAAARPSIRAKYGKQTEAENPKERNPKGGPATHFAADFACRSGFRLSIAERISDRRMLLRFAASKTNSAIGERQPFFS
jgi:hypothetical protein